jgi:mannose-6-phosphate isomerase-like protein (cupin superfamily)
MVHPFDEAIGDRFHCGRVFGATSMAVWRTTRLAYYPDHISPSGASEIRLLLQQPGGQITHVLVPPDSTAQVAVVDGSTEFLFVTRGRGRLRCVDGAHDEVMDLIPGTAVCIPSGVHYQYRNSAPEPLEFILGVVPMWTRNRHRLGSLDGAWQPGLRGRSLILAEPGGSVHPTSSSHGSWAVTRLPADPDTVAPDGSEIRVLGGEPRGGYAHCRVRSGSATHPVRHQTVVELWYVVSGAGQLWRRDDQGTEEVVSLVPGVCVDIPLATDFQFRSTGDGPLDVLLLTMPRWPGPREARPADARRWAPTG